MDQDDDAGTSGKKRPPGRWVRRILAGIQLALGTYMAGFTIVLLLRGDTQTASIMGGGVVMTLTGGLLLLSVERRRRRPTL